ncbi:uncharacterized protein LOC122021516 [Zingiber officinale]|uniref:Uncharacterized protein n=1 Tax=Zingiber officinale TaxID=94328 RepID=A0A8J5EZN5_ZINOF|nr:uncharacterized protein LOC122021516 [Zingiber officinale]KAG6477795.1 hypothetical protein ZIOFF_061226 [Zingiber officinale]
MACSASTEEKTFHVRSVSLPSQAHPTTVRVEEELHKLRICVEPSASSVTREMICNGLRHLGEVYDDMEDLLHLPCIQQGLLHLGQKKTWQQHLDGSIKLLDFFGIIKDAVNSTKESIQDLQLSVRRRGKNSMEDRLKAHIRSRKAMQKMIKKSYRDMKQAHGKCQPETEPMELSMIMRLLNEASVITRSLLCSIMHSMFAQRTKGSQWSLSSRAKRVACEDLCQSWNVDVLPNNLKDADIEKITMVRGQLMTIENSLGDLEDGLESLFRRLIRNRASILNILSI